MNMQAMLMEHNLKFFIVDPILICAKQLANHISKFNIKRKNLQGEQDITEEHVKNNFALREVLIKAGVYPKKLPQNKAKELSEL